jgi:DnaJ-class molecular chaperone
VRALGSARDRCADTLTAVCFLFSCVVQPDMVAGDVVVVLQQSDHPLFRRDGVNLFYKKTLTLLEALTGFSFTIAHLDGRIFCCQTDASVTVKLSDTSRVADARCAQFASHSHTWSGPNNSKSLHSFD